MLTAALAAPFLATGRTWTNQAGSRIEAELLRVEGDTALLERSGQTFRVPIATLSAEDQAFLRSWKPAPPDPAPAGAIRGSKDQGKKGACLAARHPDWVERLRALNVGWYYQWKAEKPASAPPGIEFVPMVFGKPNQIAPSVAYVTREKEPAAFQFLLGYNEPDQREQADLPVEAALDGWPQLISTGLPLVSPAAADPEGEWMTKFMAGIKQRGYRVDCIAIHSYGGANAAAFLDKLERVHRLFGLPLWITEFAVADWQASTLEENKHSTESVEDFMKTVLPKLDRLKYVHRYAWFSASPGDPHLGPSALFQADGSLTRLGEIYARH